MRLRLKFRLVYAVPVTLLLLAGAFLLFFNFSLPQKAKATGYSQTITSGSFIINMGVTPQTAGNGLVPYGMVYDLMVNYNVPILWSIEPTKAKDGTDFTYSATAYKGGPFIVCKEFLTTAITNRITYWTGQGVQGVYTNSALTVPVYDTLTNWPRLIIDDIAGYDGVITNYFDNAGIPAAGYSIGTPSLLTNCHDMWANPHGSPTWASHGYLYNYATVNKACIWMQCCAVSTAEGVKNTSSPFEQLNFLTTKGLKCYGAGSCGAPISENHTSNPSGPYTYSYPADPIMQFMSTMDGVSSVGLERWFQPQSTGTWLGTTKRLVTTATGSSPGEGALMAYGPAFGNATNGLVMYECGHDLANNGTATEEVAAQRAFLNFVLLAGTLKQIAFNSKTTPSALMGLESGGCSVSVSGGTPGYTYSWSSTIGGSFANPTNASTTFTAPIVATPTTGTLICVVTDACGRKNFISRPVSISTSVLPVKLKNFDYHVNGRFVDLSWVTASEINNDYFNIEHSTDGINFENIGQVRGNGNSTIDIAYSFTDKFPVNSYNYYRLKQVDYDGHSTIYGPLCVKIKPLKDFSISHIGPNPFQNKFSIGYNADKAMDIAFSLMNPEGTIVRSEQLNCNEGTNSFELSDLYDLPSGIYYAILAHQEEKEVIRLLKN